MSVEALTLELGWYLCVCEQGNVRVRPGQTPGYQVPVRSVVSVSRVTPCVVEGACVASDDWKRQALPGGTGVGDDTGSCALRRTTARAERVDDPPPGEGMRRGFDRGGEGSGFVLPQP